MKKIASKILAGILAVTLAMPTMSFDVTAAKASDGQMTDAAKSLSETQSIVYNTATLYNYSDTFYYNHHKDNCIHTILYFELHFYFFTFL